MKEAVEGVAAANRISDAGVEEVLCCGGLEAESRCVISLPDAEEMT